MDYWIIEIQPGKPSTTDKQRFSKFMRLMVLVKEEFTYIIVILKFNYVLLFNSRRRHILFIFSALAQQCTTIVFSRVHLR